MEGIWRRKARMSHLGFPEVLMKHLSQKASISLLEMCACQTAFSLQAYLIVLRFIAFHRCCLIYKLEAIPSTS